MRTMRKDNRINREYAREGYGGSALLCARRRFAADMMAFPFFKTNGAAQF